MPKFTFFNLSEEKRKNIIKKSMNLFIENKYEEINIRLISKEVGISIGSFYKYFEDKDDLYLYMLVDIENKILELEKGRKGTLLNNDDYVHIEEILDEKEIKFNYTWYDVPVEVMRKFYFGPHAKQLNSLALKDLMENKEIGKLKDNVDIELIYFIYVTAMFNMQLYFRENNIEDKDEKLRIKKSFYKDVLLTGILKQNY